MFCFLAYMAVRTNDMETHNMLTYARLVIKEVQRQVGAGWLEYDNWFRPQQAARMVQHSWNEQPACCNSHVLAFRRGEQALQALQGARSF